MDNSTTTEARSGPDTALTSMACPPTNLDSSNRSTSSPLSTTAVSMPLSPNAVDDFPRESTSSCSEAAEGSGSTKGALTDIPSSMKCPLHCSASTADCSCPATARVKATKSVQFSQMVRVVNVLSRYEMSIEERHNYWLQDFEFFLIKRRNQKQVLKFLESHEQQDENSTTSEETAISSDDSHSESPSAIFGKEEECSIRGLESTLPNESLRKRSYRFAALEEVFLEQDDQYYAGIYDDEAIAHAYLEVSVECRFRAEFRAIQDRKAIEEYVREHEP